MIGGQTPKRQQFKKFRHACRNFLSFGDVDTSQELTSDVGLLQLRRTRQRVSLSGGGRTRFYVTLEQYTYRNEIVQGALRFQNAVDTGAYLLNIRLDGTIDWATFLFL